jgi:hypothetical protein
MLKIFIKIRKKFWLQPKWRILRIYTKTLPRKKVEKLKDSLIKELDNKPNEIRAAYLKGKLEIVKLLLDEE